MRFNAFFSLVIVLSSVFVLASWLPAQHPHDPSEAERSMSPQPDSQRKVKFWTCSMHPQIRLPGPGKCPICSMDLIPVYEEETKDEGVSQLTLSETARRLAEIETSPVAYRDLTLNVKLLGRIEYDETKIAHISAWIPGRVDRLYVSFAGAFVKEGEPLFRMYSPELRSTQEEYLLAFRRWQEAIESNDEKERVYSLSMKEAAQKKLELWGILPDQIKALEERGSAQDRMDIYSPISGTVIEREAFEGKYFQTGDILFKIVALRSLWVKLDVYEKDLSLIRSGQPVRFITEAYPGEIFSGKVVFMDPFLNETTRTAKVRLEIDNPDGKLKPGLFGHAVLTHEWGTTLSIPITAPLLTGERAVVYVETEPGRYEGREVVLGPRSGEFYPVISGLRPGEHVVTRGNFKIDASLQIQAKPSMMKPVEEAPGIKAAPSMEHRH